MTLSLEISVALKIEQRFRSSDNKGSFISGVIDDAVTAIREDPAITASQASHPLCLTDELRDGLAQARGLSLDGKHAEALETLRKLVTENPKWQEVHAHDAS